MRNPARERSRNLNREVWESPSVYGGEDVNLRALTELWMAKNRQNCPFLPKKGN
ncbi:MAG: hypothetical protein IM322_15460 [Microcystis sp. M109S1]|nr:hypothetical protein [Microcystis sp. M109S1]MCA2950289.1 hypothetical protein [Microcystis sp. M112S1]